MQSSHSVGSSDTFFRPRDYSDRLLGDDPPLVDELAWGHVLERHLDGGAYWHLVGRGAREIGIEIDPRVRVQRSPLPGYRADRACAG